MRYKTINWIMNKKSPNYKPTSPQAKRRRKRGHKPRVQASSLSPRAPRSGSQGTSEQALYPGYKLPG